MIRNVSPRQPEVNISPVPGINREAEFRRFAVVFGIISDIPWEEDESKAFDSDIPLMRQTVEDGLHRRGEVVNPIPYDAEKWVLDGVTLSFSRFSEDMYHKARKFVLYEIIKHDWRAYSTIAGRLMKIASFFEAYHKENPDAVVEYIHTPDILSFIEESDYSLSGKVGMLGSLLEFYRFYKRNYVNERLPVDIPRLEEYYRELSFLLRRTREVGHYPSIPDKVFYAMHFKLMALIRDPRTPFDDAVAACMVILYMWTGLRPKEVRKLRRRCLVELCEEGKRLPFYRYISPKSGNAILSVYLFPAALEALKKLEALQTRRENVFITDYLVSFWDHQVNEPESYERTTWAYNRLLLRYMSEELSMPYGDLSRYEYLRTVIYRPVFYSFRVHLCTYLIDHGYDERWVEAHLGHLSKMIRGRYYRMKEWRRAEVKEKVAMALPEVGQIVKEVSGIIDARKPEEKDEPDAPSPAMELINIINNM